MKKQKRKKIVEQPDQGLIKSYADRIAELKKINAELNAALEEYRLKESKISDALAYAEETRRQADREIKVRYALEYKRLCAFRKKWINAVKSGTAKADYERTEKVLVECKRQLLSEFESEENVDYIEETDRLEEKFSSAEKRDIEELSEEELEELLEQV